MSGEGSVSTNASSRIRQFGLYRTIDARTEEFLRLSRKRQIKQGCACAAISTAITVTVVITVFLVYMEYGINTALNQQPLGKASWIGLLNDTLASTFEEKFSKSKLNFDRATIKLLPLLIKALKQNRYLEKIIEDYSSSSPPYEGKVTTEYTLNKGLFSNSKNWFKKPTSRLFTIEYKTSPIVYYKKPSKNLAYFTKIRKIRDYKRIMKYVNKMISDKVIDHTLPMSSDEDKTETMKPPKKVQKTSKKTVTVHRPPPTARHEKTQKIKNPSQIKMKSNKQIKIVGCKCPKQLSVLLNKIVSSIHQLLPDKRNNNTANCLKQQTKPVTTIASTSTMMTTTTTTPTTMTPITITPTTMTQSIRTSTTKASTVKTPTRKTPTTRSPTTKTPTTRTPTTNIPTTKIPTTKNPTRNTPTTKTSTTTTRTTTTSTTTSRATTNLPTTISNKFKLSTRGKNTYPLLFSEFDNIFLKEDKIFFKSDSIRHYEETTNASKMPESLGIIYTQPHIKEVISQDNLKVTTVKQLIIEPTEINKKISSTQSMTTLKELINYKEDLVTIFTPKKYVPQYNVKQSPHYNKVDSVPKLKTPNNPVNNDHNILGFVNKLTYPIKSNNSDVVTSTVSSVSTIANDAKRFDIKSFDLLKSDALITSQRLNLTVQLPSTEHLPLANIHSTTSEVSDAITPIESYITSKRVFTPLNKYYKGDYYFDYQNTAIPKMYYDSTTPQSSNQNLKITIDDVKKIKSNDERIPDRYQNYFDILSTSRLIEDEVDKATREEEYHEEYNVKPTESLSKLTSKIEKDIWELLKSNDSSTKLNSMIPVNRPTYLEIHRNGWKVDENDDYDLNMKHNVFDLL